MKYLVAAAAALSLACGGAAVAQPYGGYGSNGGPQPYGGYGDPNSRYSDSPPYGGQGGPAHGDGQSYGNGQPAYGADEGYVGEPSYSGGGYPSNGGYAYGGGSPAYGAYPAYGVGYAPGVYRPGVRAYYGPRRARVGVFHAWRPAHRVRHFSVHRSRVFHRR